MPPIPFLSAIDLTDVSTAPTAAVGTNTTQIATTAYVLANAGAAGPSNFVATFTNADLAANVLTVTHNLGVQYPALTVWDDAGKQVIPTEVTATSANACAIDLTGLTPLAGTWRVSAAAGAPGPPGATGPAGGVTSVGLSTAGVLFSVSGSPVTAAGTLSLVLLTQAPNTVLAGPVSGGAATPTVRALVAADIPAIATAGVTGLDAALAAKAPLNAPAFTGVPTLADLSAVLPGVLATGIASVTAATKNTTVTLLGTASGTLTLPAGALRAGRTLRIQLRGTLTTTTTTPTALTFLFKLGTTTVATTAAYTPAAVGTNVAWVAEVYATCRTTGTAGTVFAQGSVDLAVTTAAVTLGMTNTAAATINTTVTLALDFQLTQSNATNAQSVTSTNWSIELLN